MLCTLVPVQKTLSEAGIAVPEELQVICKTLDECRIDFECEKVEVCYDSMVDRLVITLFCEDIIMEYGRTHPFFEAIKRSYAVEFSENDGLPVVTITYTGFQNKN